jgi:hypothetical protein
MTEKKYHIYLKDRCIYNCLSEEEFDKTWAMILNFMSIASSFDREDLSYEEVYFSKETSLQSSH